MYDMMAAAEEAKRLETENAAHLHEIARLRGLLAECRHVICHSRRSIETAVRAGLVGFSKTEEDNIVANHVTVLELKAMIERLEVETSAPGGPSS